MSPPPYGHRAPAGARGGGPRRVPPVAVPACGGVPPAWNPRGCPRGPWGRSGPLSGAAGARRGVRRAGYSPRAPEASGCGWITHGACGGVRACRVRAGEPSSGAGSRRERRGPDHGAVRAAVDLPPACYRPRGWGIMRAAPAGCGAGRPRDGRVQARRAREIPRGPGRTGRSCWGLRAPPVSGWGWITHGPGGGGCPRSRRGRVERREGRRAPPGPWGGPGGGGGSQMMPSMMCCISPICRGVRLWLSPASSGPPRTITSPAM